uniref:DNA-directed RNA polymerase n=1 Tax=viral metagenome TaxID=1070528 RepID=A0A6C0C732_9ZZZZ
MDLNIDAIIKCYFNQKNILVNHQLKSYNEFIEKILPNIISNYFPIQMNFESDKVKKIIINISNVNIGKPFTTENDGYSNLMKPNEARLRNYSYLASIIVDFESTIYINENDIEIELEKKIIKNILIGSIPILLRSKYCTLNDTLYNDECEYDYGGYSIINGNEKVIISQERKVYNIPQVFQNNKATTKYRYVCEITTVKEEDYYMPRMSSIKITKKENIYENHLRVSLPHLKQEIPLFILFKALGCLNDKDIVYYIIDNDGSKLDKQLIKILHLSIEEGSSINTEFEAIEYISKYINNSIYSLSEEKKIKYIREHVLKDYLTHLNSDLSKLYFTGYMVNKLLKCYLKIIDFDDRDSYLNKRIDCIGPLLGSLTHQCFNKITKDVKNYITKEINSGIWNISKNYNDIINEINIHKIIKSNYIENSLKSSMATGNWGLKMNVNKQGVSQVLNRLSYLSTLSHIRRVQTPNSDNGKLIPPRKLHATAWGYMCPSETPEGQSVGIVKNLSMTCEITNKVSSKSIREIINKYIITFNEFNIYRMDKNNFIKIFINGEWIGFTSNYRYLINDFKYYRNMGLIHIHSSISMNNINRIIYIFTDGGRVIRPLLKVKHNKLIYNKIHHNKIINGEYKWKDLVISINNNTLCPIEYIDVYESQNILCATRPEEITDKTYSHTEIHPSLILGLLTSCIPFPHHNQAPRNTYQSAMGKQAVGVPTTKFQLRYDTFTNILSYPQKPLVDTKISSYLNLNRLPSGINVVIAIATWTGYNQEDSVIFNRNALNRGLFNSTFYRTYKDEEKKNQISGEEEKFMRTDKSNLLFPKPYNYEKINGNGFIDKNIPVDDNDIIIGKVIPNKNKDEKYKYIDSSTSVRKNEKGFTDSRYVNNNSEGYKICKVKIREHRYPNIGDKVSSRHGQKGTIGMIYEQEDMPFTKDGIVPDIIINPHAVPSRMTIAQLFETILGKACCMTGNLGNGTAFDKVNVKNIENILTHYNFDKHGNDILYNGKTGEQIHTSIFMGTTYYQRLKHMSSDKIHSRSTGPIVSATRQPSEGRASYGGLRFGEMERDCMIAHGASHFLYERMIKLSDDFSVFICNKCGLIASANKEKNIYECKSCNNYSNIHKVNIPYSCKLLMQELQTMSIAPRFNV